MRQPWLITIISFLILLTCNSLQAQQMNGIVIDKETREVIDVVHVINKRSLKGTLNDDKGYFEISIEFGDTIVFSNIGYKYYYFIYSDSASALEDVVIEMEEQNYLLSEVSIFNYKLTSNRNKSIEIKEPLYPKSEELGDGRIINAGPGNPAEFLYNLFGSKPRQLRKLAELKAEDAYREKLKENNNRESVIGLTGLSRDELEAFMFYCKYSNVRMSTMNDYEFLLSVQACYSSYVRENELEEFLNQFD